jgi:hypothetical protein
MATETQSSDDGTAVEIGCLHDPVIQLVDLRALRAEQRHDRRERMAPHRGDVRDIGRKRLPTDIGKA